VRFLGQRSDLVDLHHAFDVFVQSSDYEGTPNAVLEAMAMETPIVATDAGGTHEVARPAVDATVVPVGDAAALESGIAAVLTDRRSARTRAAAARRRIETELSFETRTRRLEAIYEDLVRQRHGHSTATSRLGTPPSARQVPHA
jgi:glycosyltransferase involved in cell wall biosynthesis